MVSDIIHAGFDNGSISGYACNSACGYHPHKISFDWKGVTCKRCLNLIKKYDRYTGREGNLVLLKDKEIL